MGIAKVPVTESDITPQWLQTVLGQDIQDVRTERIGEAYGLSSKLYRCRMAVRGLPRTTVVKLSESDRAADLREVPFYSTFGARLGIRIPRCFGGAVDGRQAVLVFEDFEQALQGDCLGQLDADGAATMARMVAALHATWWESPELAAAEWLAPMSVRTREWLLERRVKCLERFADRLTPLARQLFDQVESVNTRVEELLAGAPHTLLHADLHLDNVLFDERGPILLDWARVSRGPAAIDLVELMFLMSPEWEPVLAAYLGELRWCGVAVDETALHRQVSGALLRRFISITCGISRWDTPSERERRMIEVDQQRVFRAIEAWQAINPTSPSL
jgi:aminoglycoside phosphotransferase (APT) family kinase protein